MIDQVLLLLQALFLVLLYLFIWRVFRTASRDLRLPQESLILSPSQLRRESPEPVPRRRVVVGASSSLEPGASFELTASAITIGRSEDNVIALSNDDYASARHARIEPLRDGVWIVDLDSTNGTFVNGRKVSGRELLGPEDVIRVGNTELWVA